MTIFSYFKSKNKNLIQSQSYHPVIQRQDSFSVSTINKISLNPKLFYIHHARVRVYTHIKELLLRSVHVTYEKLSAKTSGYTDELH